MIDEERKEALRALFDFFEQINREHVCNRYRERKKRRGVTLAVKQAGLRADRHLLWRFRRCPQPGGHGVQGLAQAGHVLQEPTAQTGGRGAVRDIDH